MTRFIMPVILIGISIMLFFLFLNPFYSDVRELRTQIASYDEALSNSKALENTRDELTHKYNTIDPENLLKIKKLLPDNLAGLTDVLPILDIGEALIVGDASLLPTRVIIGEPTIKPQSATIKFWKEWSNERAEQDVANAVAGLRRQSKI